MKRYTPHVSAKMKEELVNSAIENKVKVTTLIVRRTTQFLNDLPHSLDLAEPRMSWRTVYDKSIAFSLSGELSALIDKAQVTHKLKVSQFFSCALLPPVK